MSRFPPNPYPITFCTFMSNKGRSNIQVTQHSPFAVAVATRNNKKDKIRTVEHQCLGEALVHVRIAQSTGTTVPEGTEEDMLYQYSEDRSALDYLARCAYCLPSEEDRCHCDDP